MDVESLEAQRKLFRKSGATLANDLRAAQERTDDSETKFLLGRAADEIEMLRQQHSHTVLVYQEKVRRLGKIYQKKLRPRSDDDAPGER
jgi:hypothetical protein